MRNRLASASTFALAITLFGSADTKAAYTNSDGTIITNGVVLITTRTAIDAFWRQQSTSSLWDADDAAGPGTFSPGDAQMGASGWPNSNWNARCPLYKSGGLQRARR